MKMWDFIIKYWVEFLFGIIAAGLMAGYRAMAKKIRDGKKTESAVAEGMKYLLMFKLREEGERYVHEGKCSTDEKREFEKVYLAYHELGGNGTITSLKDQVLNLPV